MSNIAPFVSIVIVLAFCGRLSADGLAEADVEVTVERAEVKTLTETTFSNLSRNRQQYVVTYRVENRSDNDMYSVIGEPYLIDNGHFIQHVAAFRRLKHLVTRRWRTSSILHVKPGESKTFTSAYPYFENFVTEFAFTSSLTEKEAQKLLAEGAGNDVWGEWGSLGEDEAGEVLQPISEIITRDQIIKGGRISSPKPEPDLPVSVRVVGDPAYIAGNRSELNVTYEFESHQSKPAWIIITRPVDAGPTLVQSLRWPDDIAWSTYPWLKLMPIAPGQTLRLDLEYSFRPEQPIIVEFAVLTDLSEEQNRAVRNIDSPAAIRKNRAWMIEKSEAIYAVIRAMKKPDDAE